MLFRSSSEVENSNLTLVTTAIETVKRDQDILKANLREAMAIGDFDKAAEYQEAMSTNAVKLLQLEQGYNEMKSRPKIEPIEPPSRNMIDDIASRVTPLSAKWIKKNRDHLEDPRAIRMMGRAHEDAIDMGIQVESDEYFRFVENRLGIGREEPRQERREERRINLRVRVAERTLRDHQDRRRRAAEHDARIENCAHAGLRQFARVKRIPREVSVDFAARRQHRGQRIGVRHRHRVLVEIGRAHV